MPITWASHLVLFVTGSTTAAMIGPPGQERPDKVTVAIRATTPNREAVMAAMGVSSLDDGISVGDAEALADSVKDLERVLDGHPLFQMTEVASAKLTLTVTNRIHYRFTQDNVPRNFFGVFYRLEVSGTDYLLEDDWGGTYNQWHTVAAALAERIERCAGKEALHRNGVVVIARELRGDATVGRSNNIPRRST